MDNGTVVGLGEGALHRADSRFAPSQWETALLNDLKNKTAFMVCD